ncbi:MAG: crossover junction endodeoxyribonuclease RuvC [Acidobacteriia bacterium]|nr:crossover junction endodeoxyribonuclease RuvC [Terriglobia bacterium]
MRVFGIDPGSERTGYGCIETDGSRHRVVICGAITAPAHASFPEKLLQIHARLTALLEQCRPDSVAIENLFHSVNVRSALKLGHARGVAMLAAVEAGVPVLEYTPAEIKRAVVGYGRAEKAQVQHMVKLLLGLSAVPSPHDAADALAVAICHVHSAPPARAAASLAAAPRSTATSWRTLRHASAPSALRRGKPPL